MSGAWFPAEAKPPPPLEQTDSQVRKESTMHVQTKSKKKHLLPLALIIAMAAVMAGLCVVSWSERGRLQNELEAQQRQLNVAQRRVQQAEQELSDLQEEYDKLLKKQDSSKPNGEIAYQTLYPELMLDPLTGYTQEQKVYLTFDDGPSERTIEILDVLKQRDIKATFFVVGSNLNSEQGQEILRRMADEGHTIGIHTDSHQYRSIYTSLADYLNDFKKVYDKVYEITGVKPEIFRFPGGSVNGYNGDIYQELIAEMMRRGFSYYDWNVSSADATGSISADTITKNCLSGIHAYRRSIVLMHDSAAKKTTAQALPGLLDTLIAEGYEFAPLTRETLPVTFAYPD